MKKSTKIIISLILLLSMVAGCYLYVSDYYHADEAALLYEYDEVADGIIVCQPENATAGIIFYPGGKVEYTAYLPLMSALCERGILSVLVEMPLNLAVLDIFAADGISDMFPEIDSWYIGGHSLGGSMAASYMESNEDIKGLILLGSYSTVSVGDRPTLSIYGENDGVMNHEKYEEYKKNIESNLTEVVIEGGNHAYFGCYGEQNGDGRATITHREQVSLTADYILDFINK